MELGKQYKNTDLEAWSSQFYELYNISKEINSILASIEEK